MSKARPQLATERRLGDLSEEVQCHCARFLATRDLRMLLVAYPSLSRTSTFSAEEIATLWRAALDRAFSLRGGREAVTEDKDTAGSRRPVPRAPSLYPALQDTVATTSSTLDPNLRAARCAFSMLPPYWPRCVDEGMLSTHPRHRIRAAGVEAQYIGNDLGSDRCVVADACFPPLLSAPWTVLRYHEDTEDGIAAHSFCAYYELDVLDERNSEGSDANSPDSFNRGREQCVAIGLAMQRFRVVGKQPGWDRKSWGLHGDDGFLYHGSGTSGRPAGSVRGSGASSNSSSSSSSSRSGGDGDGSNRRGRDSAIPTTFGPGDTVGCGAVLLPDPMNPVAAVFFTLNGQPISPDDAERNNPAMAEYFTRVRIAGGGECLPGERRALAAFAAQLQQQMGVRFAFLLPAADCREALLPVVGLDATCPVRFRFGDAPRSAFRLPAECLRRLDDCFRAHAAGTALAFSQQPAPSLDAAAAIDDAADAASFSSSPSSSSSSSSAAAAQCCFPLALAVPDAAVLNRRAVPAPRWCADGSLLSSGEKVPTIPGPPTQESSSSSSLLPGSTLPCASPAAQKLNALLTDVPVKPFPRHPRNGFWRPTNVQQFSSAPVVFPGFEAKRHPASRFSADDDDATAADDDRSSRRRGGSIRGVVATAVAQFDDDDDEEEEDASNGGGGNDHRSERPMSFSRWLSRFGMHAAGDSLSVSRMQAIAESLLNELEIPETDRTPAHYAFARNLQDMVDIDAFESGEESYEDDEEEDEDEDEDEEDDEEEDEYELLVGSGSDGGFVE